MKIRSAPSNVHTILSDLSDLSSVSSAPEHGAVAVGSASAGKTQGREGGSTKVNTSKECLEVQASTFCHAV